MMKSDEIVKALKHLRVQTGSLACMGCGHEHDCGVHGCAIMRQAADLIERLEKEKAALLESVRGGCISCKHWRGTRSIATLLAGARRAAKTANAKTAASERTGSGKDWSRKRRRRGKMADTYCTAFMEDLPPEKQAEGLGVQAAVVLGECFHCEHYARCSTDEAFVFPANAACMVRKDMVLKDWELESKEGAE